MYTSELARHQNRVVLFRYNLDLRRVSGAINTPVHYHAKPRTTSTRPSPNEEHIKLVVGRLFILNIIVSINHPMSPNSKRRDSTANGLISGRLEINAVVFSPIGNWDDFFSGKFCDTAIQGLNQ